MLTRKNFLRAAGTGTALLAAGALAACTSDEEDADDTAETDDASDDETSDEAEASDSSDDTTSTSEPVTIRVADTGPNGIYLISYAQESGILDDVFADYDVTFEFSEFKTGAAVNEAYAANELDFAVLGLFPVITGTSAEYGYKALATTSYSDYAASLFVGVDTGIESIADLEGRTVGTLIGGGYQYNTYQFLAQAGLTTDDVELINTGAETQASVTTGAVDAGVYAILNGRKAANAGEAIIISEETGGPDFAVVTGADDFVAEHTDLAVLFLQALARAAELQVDDYDSYAAYYVEKSGSESTDLDEIWDLLLHEVNLPGELEYDGAEGMLDWLKETDQLTNPDFTVDDLFDTSVAEAAGLTTQ